ncbi:unnamed protein product, partial [marine sediment metagenome]
MTHDPPRNSSNEIIGGTVRVTGIKVQNAYPYVIGIFKQGINGGTMDNCSVIQTI